MEVSADLFLLSQQILSSFEPKAQKDAKLNEL